MTVSEELAGGVLCGAGVVAAADETASWAREELSYLVSVPEYGSEAWHGLEPSDPRRQAALVIAAERWREGQVAAR